MKGQQLIEQARRSGPNLAMLAQHAESSLEWAKRWRDNNCRMAPSRQISRDMMRASALRYRRSLAAIEHLTNTGIRS